MVGLEASKWASALDEEVQKDQPLKSTVKGTAKKTKKELEKSHGGLLESKWANEGSDDEGKKDTLKDKKGHKDHKPHKDHKDPKDKKKKEEVKEVPKKTRRRSSRHDRDKKEKELEKQRLRQQYEEKRTKNKLSWRGDEAIEDDRSRKGRRGGLEDRLTNLSIKPRGHTRPADSKHSKPAEPRHDHPKAEGKRSRGKRHEKPAKPEQVDTRTAEEIQAEIDKKLAELQDTSIDWADDDYEDW